MSAEKKSVGTISELREAVCGIPRVRLDFAKAISETLSAHNISVSGDLLGKLVIATADEVTTQDGKSATWTD
jgi:hypothetical protein